MLFVVFFFRFYMKMMNADKDRLKLLLTETITLLCQRGLTFKRELHVQGLLGITVDDDVFLVPVDDRKSYSVKQPWFVNREAESSSLCDLVPRQSETVGVQQMATSDVPDVNYRADLLSSAGSPCPPSQYPAVDSESHSLTVVKTEIPDVENSRNNTENKIQLLDNGLNENLTASAQLHAGNITREGKKKRRKRCKFSKNIHVLSPDNEVWTAVSQREMSVPVVGYSQWANYGEELQHDSSVSIFKTRELLFTCLYCYPYFADIFTVVRRLCFND